MASPQPPLPENKLSLALLKSIPLSIGGPESSSIPKSLLRKTWLVELQKRSGCNTKGSGCNTKVELQKGSGCNTKVELGPKTLHCLDVPTVHPHYFGASIVQGGGGGALLIKCQHYVASLSFRRFLTQPYAHRAFSYATHGLQVGLTQPLRQRDRMQFRGRWLARALLPFTQMTSRGGR